MAEPLIRTVDLVAGYGVPVVGPFSLRMEAGDVIGLSGPNGSGKSTLVHAVLVTNLRERIKRSKGRPAWSGCRTGSASNRLPVSDAMLTGVKGKSDLGLAA